MRISPWTAASCGWRKSIDGWQRRMSWRCARACRASLVAGIAVLLAATQGLPPLAAQEATTGWGQATNLSRSGAASQPVIVPGIEHSLQVFWWDRFDGIMRAEFDGSAWLPAVHAPILSPSESGAAESPIEAMPQIMADGDGRAHAFWIAMQGEASPTSTLFHCVYDTLAQQWTVPEPVAEGVAGWRAFSDRSGRTHLVYVRSAASASAPAGVYYTALSSGNYAWMPARVVVQSTYARLVSEEEACLGGAADAEGNVVLAWYDPRDGVLRTTRSSDFGVYWSEPQLVPVEGAKVSCLVATSRLTFVAIWQVPSEGMEQILYEQRSRDGGSTWSEPERVLASLEAPGSEIALTAEPDGGLLFAAGPGSYGLLLAQRVAEGASEKDTSGWSQPLTIGLAVRNRETRETVSLESLRMALSDRHVAIVGVGQDEEIWALRRPLDDLAWAWETESSWSSPTRIDVETPTQDMPTIAAGSDGRVYAVWASNSQDGGTVLMMSSQKGSSWSAPVAFLGSPTARVENLSLMVRKDWYLLVWNDSETGSAYFTRGAVLEGKTSLEPGEVDRVPVPAQTCEFVLDAEIAEDPHGRVHLVYTVPLDRGRGVYYLRSDDKAVTWSDPVRVFDAAAGGWQRLGQTALAVDSAGSVYAAWTRQSMVRGTPEGVYFAKSSDGSHWSPATQIASGLMERPSLGTCRQGQLHVVWYDAGRAVWRHALSRDAGQEWTAARDLRGMATDGTIGLAYDPAGSVHVLGVVRSSVGDLYLRYVSWDPEGAFWTDPVDLMLPVREIGVLGVSASLTSALGRLDALIGLQDVADGETGQQEVWSTSRVVPTTGATEAWIATLPPPTATFEPSATPTSMATEETARALPEALLRTVDVGPLELSGLGLAGLAIVSLLVGAALVHRARRLQH